MWPADTTTPAAASFAMIPGVVISGASVTSVLPFRSEVSRPMALSSSPRSFAESCDTLARDVEIRALDVDAEHAGHAGVHRGAHGFERRGRRLQDRR